MRRVRLVIIALLTLGLVSGATVAPALAQAQPQLPDNNDSQNQTGNESAPGGAGNGGGNDSDGDDDSGGLADTIVSDNATVGGGGGQSLAYGGGATSGGNSAGGMMDGVAEWITEGSLNFIELVISGTFEIVIGTPTPENAGWLGIFGEPTNEPFGSLYTGLYEAWLLPIAVSLFILALLINASAVPFSGFIGGYNASRWVALMFTAAIALGLSWPVVTMLHALSDAIGTAIAPSPEQLTGTEQGIRTILAGSGTAAAALYLSAALNLIIYALIYGMRYFLLLMVMPYVFGPALAVALFAPWSKLRAFGSGVIGAHIGLLITNIPIAILFRAAFLIEWGFSQEGIANLVMVIGALVAGVIIPIVVMYQMTRMAGSVRGVAMGAGAAMAARRSYTPTSARYAKRAGNRARDIGQSAYSRAGSAKERVNATITDNLSRNSRSSRSSSTSGQSASRSRNTGGTQASRRRKLNDNGINPMTTSDKKRMRLRKTNDGWTVEGR